MHIFPSQSSVDIYNICVPPTLNKVPSEIELLKTSQVRICKNKQICNRFGRYHYFDDFGCLPIAYNSNEENLFLVENKLVQDRDSHKQAAINCGGRLADIFDENEMKVYTLRF